MESSINAPHPHGTPDPADFFGDDDETPEAAPETEPRPTPTGARPAEDLIPPPPPEEEEQPAAPEPPADEGKPDAVKTQEKLREIAEREQAEAAAAAASEAEVAAASEVQEGDAAQQQATAATAEPPEATEGAQGAEDGSEDQTQAPAASTPQNQQESNEASGGRQYHVLREIELTEQMAEALLKRVREGKRTVLFMTLDPAFAGRNPTQAGKAVFKKHHERLGVGGYGQDPLTLIPVPHSAWNRMPLGLKPRPIDDNIEVVG